MRGEFDRLARAVISQALSDAGIGAADGQRLTVSQLACDEARAFLFSTVGTWRQAREFWASLADLCPEQLRQRAEVTLRNGVKPKPKPPQDDPKCERAPGPPKIIRKRKLPMPGTKLRSVYDLLKRPEGAAMEDLMRMFEKRSTAYVAVSDLRLFGIVGKRGEDGRYRIVSLP